MHFNLWVKAYCLFFSNFGKYLFPKNMRFELYGANNLNFVEFNITGNPDLFQRCDKDSFYMDTDIFNLFSECFERSNNLFDYFGPTKYNPRNIVVLLNELKNSHSIIGKTRSLSQFMDFVSDKFMGSNFVLELEKTDKNWRLNWELYCTKLLELVQQLISLVNRCMDEEKTLWVIGY